MKLSYSLLSARLGVLTAALMVLTAATAAQPVAEPSAAATVPVEHTAPEKASFESLDKRIARFASTVEKDPDSQHKTAEMLIVTDFKKRGAALQTLAFDQTKFDDFVFEVVVEEQRLALWLRDLTTPPRTKK